MREVLLLTKKDLIKIWLKKICVVVVMVTMPPLSSSSSSIIPLPPVVIILTVISIVGAIAIPFGDPQFIDRAIALELSFVTLAIVILLGDRLTVRRVPLAKLALYACIPLAIIVMVGNSLASPHVEIMTTFSKPFNAIMLIIGGYVLQGALIGTTVFQLVSRRQDIIQKQKKN